MLVHYPYVDPVDRPVGWVHSLCARRLDPLGRRRRDPVGSARRGGARRDRGTIRDRIASSPAARSGAIRRASSRGRRGSPTSSSGSSQNDPRVVWFPGITHWPIQAIGPHRYLETPALPHRPSAQPGRAPAREGAPVRGERPGPACRGTADERRLLPPRGPARGRPRRPWPTRTATRSSRILALEPWPEPRPRARPLRVADAGGDRRPLARRAGDRRALPRARSSSSRSWRRSRSASSAAVLVRVVNSGTHVWPHGRRRLAPRSASPIAGRRRRHPSSSPTGCAPRCRRRSHPTRRSSDAGRRAGAAVAGRLLARRSICSTSTCAGSAARRRQPSTSARPPRRVLADDEAAPLAAAALAEVAPSVRPLVLHASPGADDGAPRVRAAPDPRATSSWTDAPRGGLSGVGGVRCRRARRRSSATPRARLGRPRAPRLDSSGDALSRRPHGADALLVVGDAALRGGRGEREALQQRSAVLAARGPRARRRRRLHARGGPGASASPGAPSTPFTARGGRSRRRGRRRRSIAGSRHAAT